MVMGKLMARERNGDTWLLEVFSETGIVLALSDLCIELLQRRLFVLCGYCIFAKC